MSFRSPPPVLDFEAALITGDFPVGVDVDSVPHEDDSESLIANAVPVPPSARHCGSTLPDLIGVSRHRPKPQIAVRLYPGEKL